MTRIRCGVVMDPIAGITATKDSTLALLLEAQTRGQDLVYFEQGDLSLRNGQAWGSGRALRVADHHERWHELGPPEEMPLGDLDVLLMRKDPPFDMEYVYTTYILQRAEEAGTLVINRPNSLRNINEKAFTAWFPQCCPDTLVTRSIREMRDFLHKHQRIVVKPLDGMGGQSIFVVSANDKNTNVIFETLTHANTRFAIAQRYIPEITAGDKRIILVDGEPASAVLARIPAQDDNRGNLVMGAKPQVRPLTERDRWICSQVGPVLRERGVVLAGLDVIGDFLTEINVTSPTGLRELAKLGGLKLASDMMDVVERKVQARRAAA